jgi:phage protein D
MIVSTRPVFTVGGEVHGELARDALRVEVEEDTEGLRTLTVVLGAQGSRGAAPNQVLLYLDGSPLDFGTRVEVSMGPHDARHTVFKGRVSAIEADFAESREPHVLFLAEDGLMALRTTRRMRTYTNVTDAAIAQEVAGEHQMSVVATASGPTYDVVQQWNMSDLAFLRQRARLVQAEVWIEDDTIHFESRSSRQGTPLTLVRGNHLLEVQVRADLAHQRTQVRVSGYDAANRDAIDEQAGQEAIAAEASGTRTGPQVLADTFGDRVSYRVREAPLAITEATEWARFEMLRRARGFVKVYGVTRGSPDMVVGSRLTLQKVGAPFSGGDYYATRVRHTYDRDAGYRTQFEAERAAVSGT